DNPNHKTEQDQAEKRKHLVSSRALTLFVEPDCLFGFPVRLTLRAAHGLLRAIGLPTPALLQLVSLTTVLSGT
ncbi:MAG TPA: hypothetical protein VES20_03275, partial [Bryobacteraceae bacterium]|nr:hypothetical protein [Bryobacteraceae bacterium]